MGGSGTSPLPSPRAAVFSAPRNVHSPSDHSAACASGAWDGMDNHERFVGIEGCEDDLDDHVAARFCAARACGGGTYAASSFVDDLPGVVFSDVCVGDCDEEGGLHSVDAGVAAAERRATVSEPTSCAADAAAAAAAADDSKSRGDDGRCNRSSVRRRCSSRSSSSSSGSTSEVALSQQDLGQLTVTSLLDHSGCPGGIPLASRDTHHSLYSDRRPKKHVSFNV